MSGDRRQLKLGAVDHSPWATAPTNCAPCSTRSPSRTATRSRWSSSATARRVPELPEGVRTRRAAGEPRHPRRPQRRHRGLRPRRPRRRRPALPRRRRAAARHRHRRAVPRGLRRRPRARASSASASPTRTPASPSAATCPGCAPPTRCAPPGSPPSSAAPTPCAPRSSPRSAGCPTSSSTPTRRPTWPGGPWTRAGGSTTAPTWCCYHPTTAPVPARGLPPHGRPQPGLAGPPQPARPAGPGLPRRLAAAHPRPPALATRAAGLAGRLQGGLDDAVRSPPAHAVAYGMAADPTGPTSRHLTSSYLRASARSGPGRRLRPTSCAS